mgnify:CR=1 FL=1|jgi:hypothetical protein
MKQLKIIVALVAGLFAFTSVQAGEMTVTGGMHATYQSEKDDVTGNPLGMNTDLKFAGSQDTDFGAVTWTMATDGVFVGESGADHTLKLASDFGTFKIGNAGDSANAIDDITPTAFEEANGSGSGTYVDYGAGMEGSMSVGYNLANVLGTGLALDATYYPKLDGQLNNEKAASGGSATHKAQAKSATSINLKADMGNMPVIGGGLEGLALTVGAYESDATLAGAENKGGVTAAINYAAGPIKFGVQKSSQEVGQTTLNGQEFYKDTIVGVAYAINDSLAISYNTYTSSKHNLDGKNDEQETKAINIAYTIGGLTIGFQDAGTDNAGYVDQVTDDTQTISIKTAF